MPQIIVVLGVAGGIPASRIVRGAVIGVKENAYFQAAQAIGTSTGGTLLRHVLPNIAAPVLIVYSINVGNVIISEASLSFLGFGLPAVWERRALYADAECHTISV
ncbi:MAG: ABC transporter permease subunit [Spirochaetaceae bacterium]|nr:ABC transporter permease subunit [Spirochaetaceae bacterium]